MAKQTAKTSTLCKIHLRIKLRFEFFFLRKKKQTKYKSKERKCSTVNFAMDKLLWRSNEIERERKKYEMRKNKNHLPIHHLSLWCEIWKRDVSFFFAVRNHLKDIIKREKNSSNYKNRVCRMKRKKYSKNIKSGPFCLDSVFFLYTVSLMLTVQLGVCVRSRCYFFSSSFLLLFSHYYCFVPL